ncbi:MAG: threonine--tRNA ligase, partial [Bacteroidales bacterium]|nr:threonine--tRNA ligase [Bacteroidales bacterium]
MINITFPDGAVKPFVEGITAYEIAESISPRLAADVLAAQVNGVVYDLNRPIDQDATISLLKWDSDDAKRVFWHSSSHLMAEALEALYPGVKFGIGPAVENGFYYDVDLCGQQITDADLPKIEKKMLELAARKEEYKRIDVSKADALKYFASKGDQYKVELINELQDGTITYYENGDFTDLCRGPHLRNTEVIKAVKLTAIAGAYWRGDEKRQQLTRIYGITFPKKSMLEEYLVMMEEAKKRDHRKLGKEMELFTFSQRVGLGLPLWLPRGAVMRNILEGFLRKKQTELGYLPVVTPHIGSKELYITSGHYAKYGKDSFQPIRTPQEGEEYMLKPMNCPHHCEIFRSSPRSYRDLPLRFAEFGTVYRYEQSGELHGLTRVRGFTQDDAHLFCRPDQLQEEFEKVIDLILYVFKTLKMTDYMAQISLRDPKNTEKYIGSDENWEKAEKAIIDAAEKKGLKTVVELGEAAFYGPKLDFMVKDAIGRKWQLGTIQVDYNLPERFDLEYTAADGSKQRPVMIHRAPIGSLERFTAVVLEHTAGHLPLWLSPDQVKVLPISEKYADYAEKICELLKNSDIRASIDARNETLGKRIREISLLRVPVLAIVGEKEATEGTVSVRREGADVGSMTAEQ